MICFFIISMEKQTMHFHVKLINGQVICADTCTARSIATILTLE